LTSAICLKQKLIDEKTEKLRNAKRLTEQYDEQLNHVMQAIRQMRSRRDRELSKLGMKMLLIDTMNFIFYYFYYFYYYYYYYAYTVQKLR